MKIYSATILKRKHGFAACVSYQGGDVTMTQKAPQKSTKEMAQRDLLNMIEFIGRSSGEQVR